MPETIETPTTSTEHTTTEATEVGTTATETHATTEHTGPHIPTPKGSPIADWSIGSIAITNTILSTWIFMVLLFALVAVFYRAIRSKKSSMIQSVGLDVTNRLLSYSTTLLGSKAAAHKYLWLLGGIMVVVLVGNIYGLGLDFLTLSSSGEWLAEYVRPIYSDLATTLTLSLSVIVIAQVTALHLKWPRHQAEHYLWHWHGDSIAEKIVSVFIWWLHFVGEFIRIGSLSMRLFLNIFVGMILIAVSIYIGEMIPAFGTGVFRFLSLPFWFFELLVAFLQAYIFMTLSALYIRESLPDPHHLYGTD